MPSAVTTGRVLSFPARSLVLVCGVPGAGKSTLLRHLFGLTGAENRTVLRGEVRVVDSHQSRLRLTPALAALPYTLWRWLVHVLHLLRVAAALRGGPVAVHESGTRRWVRLLLALLGRLRGYTVHGVMIDASPDEALSAQRSRGRAVTARSHRAQTRRWRRLCRARERGPGALVPGAASLTVLARHDVRRLVGVRFGSAVQLTSGRVGRSARS
ncbi:AAA family ATPase [Nocardiopsis sp. LSu2-4]|uniref:AAA family ATPase n=1 Tax=Nocardiopsis suaedae TaxID=3018444 RepID=A0ABT4TTA9_9ACTN|nr:AAA family ATPase [Nocardiopsis suaedae]MDA2807917.1 AAA family ATPase [Nocardiopsis suaedae]